MIKRLLCLATGLLLSASAFATQPGYYFGLTLGYSKINTQEDTPFSIAGTSPIELKTDTGGLGGRVYFGYNIEEYVGLELAYFKPSESEYRKSTGTGSASLKFTADIYELSLKGYLPIASSDVDIWGRVGGDLVRQHTKYRNASGQSLVSGKVAPEDGTHSTILPSVGVGINYRFAEPVSMVFEVSRVFGKHEFYKDRKAFADMDYIGLGIVYHFI